jgi:hypothetical protein
MAVPLREAPKTVPTASATFSIEEIRNQAARQHERALLELHGQVEDLDVDELEVLLAGDTPQSQHLQRELALIIERLKND